MSKGRARAALVAAAGVVAAGLTTGTTAVAQSADELQALDLVNQERVQNALAPLFLDDRLFAAVRRHADDMAAGEFTSATGSDGSSVSERAMDAGYPEPGLVGSGVASGQPAPADVIGAWLDSPGTRAALLGLPFQGGAVAVATSASGVRYWTFNVGVALPASSVDSDGDGVADDADNCPDDANPIQRDCDGDGAGDVCDPHQPGFDASGLLAEVNTQREVLGLCPLAADARLARAAERHAADMAANETTSQIGSDGSTFDERLQDEGYPLDSAAAGSVVAGLTPTPAATVALWIASPGAEAQLNEPSMRGFGGAVAASATGDLYWNAIVGTQVPASPTPVPIPGWAAAFAGAALAGAARLQIAAKRSTRRRRAQAASPPSPAASSSPWAGSGR